MKTTLILTDYYYWDDLMDDNKKRFHYMKDSNGVEPHIDFSPYHYPTDEEIDAVRKIAKITGEIPTREWNHDCNFSFTFDIDVPDIARILESVEEVERYEQRKRATFHYNGGKLK